MNMNDLERMFRTKKDFEKVFTGMLGEVILERMIELPVVFPELMKYKIVWPDGKILFVREDGLRIVLDNMKGFIVEKKKWEH